uniref:Protein deacetylase HDAC6 n=1 Tax=Oncorhynchus tshawytscha TaxID=74940 RepID=A0AAZ3NPH8_ONCTS
MESVPEPRSVRRSPRMSKSPDNNAAKKESGKTRKKTSNLQETRRRGRMDRSKGEEDIANQLNNLDLCNEASATGTGLVFDSMFTHHRCLWDPSHPECPERVSTVMDTVEKQGLLSRCVTVEARAASNEELHLVHTKEYVDLMRSTQRMDEDQLKTLSDSYDSVYIHPESYSCASLAVGSVLQLVDKVMTSELRNGFSVARPPGHHAQVDQMNGYCMFNNLAIAARYAQTRHRVERVLIVDWDVHHGQGIQYIFQEDPSVLYFSVHRYEEGLFWPHLPESDSSAVGTGSGEGYNINLPWNKVLEHSDVISPITVCLLQFQPQLVLVAAGFDSVIGDPKGEMSASPQCFSVLTHMLLGLAQGKLLLVLEGGYNLQSTAEGVCACLRSLLGESCPRLRSPSIPSDSALKSISRSISALYPYWTSLQVLEGGPLSDSDPLTPAESSEDFSEELCEERRDSLDLTTGLVYDQRMMEHHNMWDSHHPELPQRIQRIFSRHDDLGLVSRCLRIPARLALEEELALCHSLEHIAKIKATEGMKTRDLHRLGDEYNSIFISTESYRSARLAAGACPYGVAIVRPPGHHAEKDAACGFCFFNTVALTARYAQSISQKPLRVLILDWDVHHGNGTQHIFEEDDSVLYISLHRYEDGTFFPTSEDAHYNRVGEGKGAGFNVNIPWNGAKMGDAEYLAAFHSVVMPIAREFDPGLVLVSAGFDAARGDPLGGYQVTPPGYAHLTHLLMGLAAGRVLVILEGGYNLTAISESMSACTSILLGDPALPLPPLPPPHPNAAVSINKVIRTHSVYWLSLRIQLPESLRLSLPNPKPRGKRTSKGKKSPRQGNQGGTTPLPSGDRGDLDLDDLTKGLVSLDLNQSTSANPSPASVPVGGARSKVRLSPMKSPVFKVETEAVPNRPEILQPTPDETETPVRNRVKSWSHTKLTMYVVDPLSWCPHLDSVRPVPVGGIDVFRPCEDCGTDTENWICLCCYKVYCGRYVNQHMLTHGVSSEHRLVLSFADLSVWCYSCQAYVHNQVRGGAGQIGKVCNTTQSFTP